MNVLAGAPLLPAPHGSCYPPADPPVAHATHPPAPMTHATHLPQLHMLPAYPHDMHYPPPLWLTLPSCPPLWHVPPPAQLLLAHAILPPTPFACATPPPNLPKTQLWELLSN